MTVTQLTFDLKSLQQKLVHEEKEKTTFQTRLEAYQNLLAERDLQMQRFWFIFTKMYIN